MEFVDREVKRFRHPFTCRVAGPSGCGKTVLVKNIIEHFREVIVFKDPVPILKVIWAYGVEGAVNYAQFPEVEIKYSEGLPSTDEIKGYHLLIIDDLMSELANSTDLSQLFTRGRHLDISTIFLVQNALPQGREMRNVNLNTNYLILFNNPNNADQTEIMARRMYPKQSKYFMEAFNDATSMPYGYIRRDNTTLTPNKFRLQTNIIPVSGVLNTTCYLIKDVR